MGWTLMKQMLYLKMVLVLVSGVAMVAWQE
jgi:hypothetical protein